MNINELKTKAIEAMGFDRLNAMQEETLQTATTGHDILLLSPTGTGKTLAFLLPLVWFAQNDAMLTLTSHHTAEREEDSSHPSQRPAAEEVTATAETKSVKPKALILVPSRELALQISEVFRQLHTGLRVICCYGGHDLRIEQQAFASLPEASVIVGTSGRIKDHLERGSFSPDEITRLVLDEYDKSLELGFEEEMKAIVSQLTRLRQRILTSATHSMPIAKYLGIRSFDMVDYLKKETDNAGGRKAKADDTVSKYALADNLTLRQVKSPIADKLDTLLRLLCSLQGDAQAIVFSNYRESSERISHFLMEQGIDNALYHGGLDQALREKALIRFRGGSIRVLVSTDLASRGLDIPEVEHIIHYHLPSTEEAFTHRNGRTARAGASGTAYILLGPSEYMPEYIGKEPTYYNLPAEMKPFVPTRWETIYIGRGKREKISKGDVLGFFMHNAGITAEQIGRIDIQEHCSYAAIGRDIAEEVLAKVRGLKIKGEKTHYLIVKGS